MLTIRLINKLLPASKFATPFCSLTTSSRRSFRDASRPVDIENIDEPIATAVEAKNVAAEARLNLGSKRSEAIENASAGEVRRKPRSDAGTPRGPSDKPRRVSDKPRKKRKDAGVARAKGPKKTFAAFVGGPAIAPGSPATTAGVETGDKAQKPKSKIGTKTKGEMAEKSPNKKDGKPKKSREEAGAGHNDIFQIGFAKDGDKLRQNIVSEALCDDVLERLTPSLEKHRGCDIIDINPGIGLWSSKLHDILKPRTHILMEPDYNTYLPYLEDLLDKEDSKYKLLPLSGLLWENLNKLESEGHLPHQTLRHFEDPEVEKPNNSLLLVANLGYWPRKPYIGFSSITNLVVHQLLTASRAHSIFHGYGQVRMLIWMHDLEKRIVLPRLVSNRRKSSVEAEISCEYIHEIAGADQENEVYRREQSLDLASGQRVAPKMAAAGLRTPPHRMGVLEAEAADAELAATETVGIRRPFEEELMDLEERLARKAFPTWRDEKGNPHYTPPPVRTRGPTKSVITRSKEFKRIQTLRWRLKAVGVHNDAVTKKLDSYEALEQEWSELLRSSEPNKEARMRQVEKAIKQWRKEMEKETVSFQHKTSLHIEERRGMRTEPPLLMWDRRTMEPLIVNSSEFLPQQPMALLDFKPRNIWPILRDDRLSNYDYFEFMLMGLFIMPTQSIVAGLRGLAPGADEWILPRCPSMKDTTNGGVVDLGLLTVRSLNEQMLREMFEAFMSWPFRPSKAEMMSRSGTQDVNAGEDTEGL